MPHARESDKTQLQEDHREAEEDTEKAARDSEKPRADGSLLLPVDHHRPQRMRMKIKIEQDEMSGTAKITRFGHRHDTKEDRLHQNKELRLPGKRIFPEIRGILAEMLIPRVENGVTIKEPLNKKNSPGFLLPALFDTGHNRIEILTKPLFALFRIIPAPMGIALDEPDCISGPEVFHQNTEPLDPDLIQCLRFHPTSPPSATARDYVLWW